MRILIYGAGAVGCYLGAHLGLAGHQVVLVGRDRLAAAVKRDGLALRTAAGGEQVIPNIEVVTSPSEAMGSAAFDWIGFTMKAYDTVEAIHELQRVTLEPPPVVSFQNGIGNEESLRAAFGEEQVIAGALTTAVSMADDRIVIEERARGAATAGDSAAAGMVAEAFRQTAMTFEVIPSGATLKWSKLLLNMLANATCAILDMTPGEVMRHPDLYRLEIRALREAMAIMDLQGIEVVNLPGAPAKLLVRGVRWLPARVLHPVLYRQVAGGRGDKLPSLLVTLRAGRRETEAPWLNGGVAQAASAIKRYAPINHALALLVTDIASGRVAWESYRGKPEELLRAMRVVEGMPRGG